MNNPQFDLIVIGGGPAGFFGALRAAEVNPGLKVLIVEKGRKLLRKVRISGGGRCNVTHACFDPAELVGYYPRGHKELRGAFSRFQPGDTIGWFESRGVKLKAEADGRMFPITDSSETIIECLLGEAKRLGISIQTGTEVRSIFPVEDGFQLELTSGGLFTRKVLLAAGGGSASAYQLAVSLGHTMIKPVPSLFTFNIQDPRLAGLAGITVSEVGLSISQETAEKSTMIESSGPVLVTHWGLSGPAALKLSAWGARVLAEAGYRLPLKINWLPLYTSEAVFRLLRQNKISHPRQQISSHPGTPEIPVRLWKRLVERAGIPLDQSWTEISDRNLRSLVEELTAGMFQISGKGVFKDEFVTCGGVALREVDFRTMESRITPGVYFAGEMLDIDGVTGGFNFQAAWTTGWLAGTAIGG